MLAVVSVVDSSDVGLTVVCVTEVGGVGDGTVTVVTVPVVVAATIVTFVWFTVFGNDCLVLLQMNMAEI